MAERDGFNQPFDPTRTRPKRPATDFGSTYVQWGRNRIPRDQGGSLMEQERASHSYIVDMLPPASRITNAATTVPVKALHTSLNKNRHFINVVLWTPEGRRLLTGAQSGEFTLWNGMGFNFETIMQAHDGYIRDAKYSHSGEWLISADHDGWLKYWQPNFNNVNTFRAHNDPVHALAFSPTDSKFVSASHDTTLKLWDFATGTEESKMTGHGWEAKCVDWHPHRGLIVSGSKDHQVKLWDPRTQRCLTTLHGHKNTIQKTLFEPSYGDMLATCARDHVARIFDLRMMRDILLLKGHEKDIMTLCWHPMHPNMISTGGFDGALHHYLLDEQNAPEGTNPTLSPYDSMDPHSSREPAQSIWPAHRIKSAHEQTIWTMDWHPLGHLLATGSQDKVTRFWTRARPGDTNYKTDRYHVGKDAAEAHGNLNRYLAQREEQEQQQQEEEDEAEGLVDQMMPSRQPGLPGLPGISADGSNGGLPGLSGLLGPGAQPFPGAPPQVDLDPAKLHEIFGGQLPPPPMPLPGSGPNQFPIPPPGVPGMPPIPPNMLPPNFQGGFPPLPGGFPMPPPGMPGFPLPPPQSQTPDDSNVRRRAPLPPQDEALKHEIRQGNYRPVGRR